MIRVFSAGGFENTHENRDRRRIVRHLVDHATEPLDVFVAPRIPRMAWRLGEGVQSGDEADPDLIIRKKHALIVVEVKSHGGRIAIPGPTRRWDGAWTFDYGSGPREINKGKSPYAQAHSNRLALMDFLRAETQALPEEVRLSDWSRMHCVVLLTGEKVSYGASGHPEWKRTLLAALDPADAEFRLAEVVADIQTPDPTTEYRNAGIHAPGSFGDWLAHRLGMEQDLGQSVGFLTDAPPFAGNGMGDGSRVAPVDYGVLRVYADVVGSRAENEPAPVSDLPTLDPDLPLPLRALRYFRHSLREEARRQPTVDLARPQGICLVQDAPEPFLFGPGHLALGEAAVPQGLSTGDVDLSYGFCFVVTSRGGAGGDGAFETRPLFTVRLEVHRTADAVSFERIGSLAVNSEALRRIEAFRGRGDDELSEYLAALPYSAGPAAVVRRVFADGRLGDLEGTVTLGAFDPAGLHESLVQIGAIYAADAGYYTQTIADLEQMEAEWTDLIAGGKEPADAAWKLLTGIRPAESVRAWPTIPESVIPSNLEQSQAIAQALDEGRDLVVVSGPPGTGKTQLVVNLVANAWIRGTTLLLASYGNRVVDLLVARCNGVPDPPYPLVLRIGTEHIATQTIALLEDLLRVGLPRAVAPDPAEIAEWDAADVTIRELVDRWHRPAEIERELADLELQVFDVAEREYDLFRAWDSWRFAARDGALAGLSRADALSGLRGRVRKELASTLPDRFARMRKGGLGLLEVLSAGRFEACVVGGAFRDLARLFPALRLPDAPGAPGVGGLDRLVDRLLEIDGLMARIDELQGEAAEIDFGAFEADWRALDELRIPVGKGLLDERRSARVTRAGISRAQDFVGRAVKTEADFRAAVATAPCYATTTLSVREGIPCRSGIMDLVVIDEAANCGVGATLPCLFRAKRAVIVGDELQLRPISHIPGAEDRQVAEAFGLPDAFLATFGHADASVLDAANHRLMEAGQSRILLREHYRSHPAIIGFSNRYFYNGHLELRGGDDGGIFWIDVDGTAALRWHNTAEVERVVELVRELQGRGWTHDQIGIVTPFRDQARRIGEALAHARLHQGPYGSILVSTAHGFQGGERDVMVFSLVVAPGMAERSVRWIHDPSSGAKNLLNVAITRARRELHVVGRRASCIEAGGLLGEFAGYVQAVESPQ